jgi:hypothetical protein
MDYLAVWFCSVHDLPGCIALPGERSLSLQRGAVLPPPHYFLNCSFDGHQLLDLKKTTPHDSHNVKSKILLYKGNLKKVETRNASCGDHAP